MEQEIETRTANFFFFVTKKKDEKRRSVCDIAQQYKSIKWIQADIAMTGLWGSWHRTVDQRSKGEVVITNADN